MTSKQQSPFERAVATLDAEVRLSSVARLAAQATGAPSSLISIVAPASDRQIIRSSFGVPPSWGRRMSAPSLPRSFCQLASQSPRPLIVEDARRHPLGCEAAPSAPGLTAFLGAPILGPDGEAVGALCVVDPVPRAWTEDEVASLQTLAGLLRDQIRLESLLRRERRRSAPSDEVDAFRRELGRTDDAMRNAAVVNHDAFMQSTVREVARMRRNANDASILLADIDLRANGVLLPRNCGAAAMNIVAERLANAIRRDVDVLARCSAATFGFLLPETDLSGARAMALRCSKAVASTPIETPDGRVFEAFARFGAASLRAHRHDIGQTLSFARSALQSAQSAERESVRATGGD